MSVPERPPHTADLGVLTGLRSGKRSYYPAYVRSTERLERTVEALDGISRALVPTAEGPRALVEAVVRTAAEHLQARWLLLAVADGALRAARPRFLLYADDVLIDDETRVPAEVREHLRLLRTRPWEAQAPDSGPGWVRVPMTLDDEPVGGIAARPGAGVEVADTDLAILRVLANQAAVAVHNTFLFHAAATLRGRTEELSEAAERQAHDLAARNAELAETQARLLDALQRQALDDERRRIARELHDSVTQYVLSAGMTVEVCRAELEGMGEVAKGLTERLADAKDLNRQAVERLRAAIYALHSTSQKPAGPLPVMLQQLSTVHLTTDLDVRVHVAGSPLPLPPEAEQSLLRLTGEALFNSATHGKAGRALVRLRYLPGSVVLTVSDDGNGDPAQLRRALRLSRAADLAGRHRGLANMVARAEELGGRLSIRRSGMGGVLLRVDIPQPVKIPGDSR
ncbi:MULTISPECIES: MadS family sensor histidine kinase [Streptomyces]|uniref:Sensor histidine kinase n=2 Tax=Streptomyces TaxID=1883 RepID=A0A3M8FAT8_9ACTN|nr:MULTISPECIES: histidine kinase [Streptomyces]KNE82542.1 histidine kinase [Streptomyces fradiae]OFA52012.1 histidine kinase [Streptomyces fradiae]PQM23100.1 sensor histidine kinase [Streptomyces xinghaiensis]RKM91465.1 sensor histidine kinase [Streptomyces xinghaiensis]RNC74898.1 sensor histidine kinase [Streptomyces xinghaiensis]